MGSLLSKSSWSSMADSGASCFSSLASHSSSWIPSSSSVTQASPSESSTGPGERGTLRWKCRNQSDWPSRKNCKATWEKWKPAAWKTVLLLHWRSLVDAVVLYSAFAQSVFFLRTYEKRSDWTKLESIERVGERARALPGVSVLSKVSADTDSIYFKRSVFPSADGCGDRARQKI